jgi:fructose-bisphosphate aldolase class I
MDESIVTCDRRFAAAGIEQEAESRRAYRELLVSTPRLAESVCGAILYDETNRQRTRAGTPLIDALADAAIIPGIKVDAGTVPMAGHPGERMTEGLDGLRARLVEQAGMRARLPSGASCSPSVKASPAAVRGQCRRAGPLCRALPGGRAGPDRGAPSC